jgi:hypothetical protein
MKITIRLCLLLTLMSSGFSGMTQGFVENALIFSRTKPGGSARIQAMGGAQIALGGDFSSALSNPAGLGMYNRSEITFSPAINMYESEASYLGGKSTASKNVFNIPGLSYVHHLPNDRNGFFGGAFGGSMTRINDFNNTFQYAGVDDVSSIIDFFKEAAAGYAINELPGPYEDTPLLNFDVPEGLAYQTFLINPFSEADPYPNPFTEDDYLDYTNYFSELDTIGNEVRTFNRNQKVNVKGSQYQWSLAYGGNYKDKLFFGASIGITTLRYKYSTTYRESDFNFSSDPAYNPLNSLRLNEDLVIDGSGVNLTLGVIYRPVNFVQIGVSFVTPTYYQISDSYRARLRADWNIRGDQDDTGESIVSEYTITTPLKFSTGAAFFLGKYGVVTGDVEFVNYGKAKYNSDTRGVSFSPENDDIKYYYTNVMNYRLGLELRYNVFRLRGGYNFQPNPYKRETNTNIKVSTISFGAGVRFNKFYIDATWLTSQGKSSFSQYTATDADGQPVGPVAFLNNRMTSTMLTVGFTF